MIKEQKTPMSKRTMKVKLSENQNQTLREMLNRKKPSLTEKRKDIRSPLCSTTQSENARFLEKKKTQQNPDSSEQNTIVWMSLYKQKEDFKHCFISLAQDLKIDNAFLESTFAEDGNNVTFGVHFFANTAT